MSKINILDFEFICSLGNKQQTVKNIKESNIKIDKKHIDILTQPIDVPFYSFEKPIEQNQNDIYNNLKNIVSKVIKNIPQKDLGTTAIIVGTSIVDWYLVDAINASAYENKKQPYKTQKTSIDTYAKRLSDDFALNGYTMTINTACTSSANGLLEAKNLLEEDIFTNIIVIGLEVFSPVMSSGFYSMELIANNTIKPLDKDRDGLILGEAICAMVLSRSDGIASIEGGFSNCNSQTITSVSSSGDECFEVIQNSLDSANLKSSDITALKAHATGSLSNDEAEINAISKIFNQDILITALKPYIGHTIGACGILEIAVMLACVDDGFIPKTLNCENPILENYKPIEKNHRCSGGIFMFNYFGFGGNNTSIILKKSKK